MKRPAPAPARKRFGQHFLADAYVVGAIVDLIEPAPGQALVEIGPGRGALTWPLLQRCQELTVVELDRDLAHRLRAHAGLTVIEADILKLDIASLPRSAGQRLRLVGNLPYNISTPILFHLLGAVEHVADQHFMLQKEVARRMAAPPGGKAYGRLSVMLQWRYHIEALLEVPPQAFDPPPKVDSTIVRMTPLTLPAAAMQPALLGEVVALAFSQRRKLLRHTLGRWIAARGLQCDFDLQRRAEEVPVEQYVALAQAAALATPA